MAVPLIVTSPVGVSLAPWRVIAISRVLLPSREETVNFSVRIWFAPSAWTWLLSIR